MENTADNKRFQVKQESFGNQLLLKLFDSKTSEFISLLPETGGMLHSVEFLIGNTLIPILDNYKNEDDLKQTFTTSFKGCNLFPFPNRIEGGKYEYNSVNYQLHVNFPHENNAIHGLIIDKPFEIIETISSDKVASVKLGYSSKGDLPGYPFQFQLEVEYLLEENNGFTLKTSFTNLDNKSIPVGNGWHPYFQLQSKVDELIFSFPSVKTFEVNNKMIPTGKINEYKLFQNPVKIKSTEFDTCFGLNEVEGKATTTIKDPVLQGGITIWQETGKEKFNFLQIYTPPARKTIAIEPMTCTPNALNNKIGLINLMPKQKLSVSWGVSILK